MGVSRRGAFAVMALAAAAAAAFGLGDDGSDPVDRPQDYAADWGRQYDPRADRPPRLDRQGLTVPISVMDGSCFPGRGDTQLTIRRRLRSVQVRDTREAVVIAVTMRPERRPPDDLCPGVGGGFAYNVPLRRPVGRRAVIRKGAYEGGSDLPIVWPSLDTAIQHRLERRYAVPAARTECAETPADTLKLKYETRSTEPATLAEAVTKSTPKAARASAYGACVAELRD